MTHSISIAIIHQLMWRRAVVLLGAAFLLVSCSQREEPVEETVTVIFSNDMVGEIRSCGCAHKDYGGLGRRATFVSGARKRFRNVLLVDAGDFFGSGINYGKEKADLTLQAMALMGYDGVTLGEKDLSMGLDFVKQRCEALKIPVLAGNLIDISSGRAVFPASRVVTMESGLRAALIGVISDKMSLPAAISKESLKIVPPQAVVERELAALPADVDVVVVISHMRSSEAQRLAREVPGIDLITCGHEARPPRKAIRYGDAFIVQTSNRGRYIGLIDAVLDPERAGLASLVYSMEPLTKMYEDAEPIVKLFQAYDIDITNQELARVRATVPTQNIANAFVGAEGCRPCHGAIADQWSGTVHAHAFDILEQQQRQYDRDCTPCHTTGFYEIGGFTNVEHTPEYEHVQCEACHGNGSRHAADPKIQTTGVPSTACRACHTKDQSPDFEFGAYWSKIAH